MGLFLSFTDHQGESAFFGGARAVLQPTYCGACLDDLELASSIDTDTPPPNVALLGRLPSMGVLGSRRFRAIALDSTYTNAYRWLNHLEKSE